MSISIRKIILMITDAVLLNIAFALALVVRFEFNVPGVYWNLFLENAVIITIVNIIIFYMFGLYKTLWRYAGMNEILKVALSVIGGTFAIFVLGKIIDELFPRTVYIIGCLITILAIGSSRISYRFLRALIRNIRHSSNNIKRVMIIGGGDAGAMLVRELHSHSDGEYIPVAIIDDNKWKWGAKISGIPIKGGINKIKDVAKSYKIDLIIIAIPSAKRKTISEIISICKQTGCKLKTLPGLYDLVDNKVSIKNIRDVSIEDLLGREEVKLNTSEIAGYLEDQVVLVTGGGGSIGAELCRQIANFKPRKIIVFDIYENSAYELQYELKRKHPELDLSIEIASVRDKDRIKSVFKKYRPTVVFHAAAHKHVPLMEDNPQEAVNNNIIGTLITAGCADEFAVKRFVLISTDKAVNPTSVMGATKRVAEMIIQSMDKLSRTEYVAVRFGNVLGSSGSVVPIFKQQIASGGPVTVSHKDVTRYFMTIPEAVMLVIQAGAMANGGEMFVLDMGEPIKIIDLAKDLITLSGFTPFEDIKIEYTGLKPGEKMFEELFLEEEGLKATRHKGILVAPATNYMFAELLMWIGELEENLESEERLRKILFEMVKKPVINEYSY
jgi:FlaA1/EpsC-like NDP-sugar epimerase